MTEQEALSNALYKYAKENIVRETDFESGWDSALEWARSQQEPKCWMQESVDVESRCYNLFLSKEEAHEDATAEPIPLYTHPAPATDVQMLVDTLKAIEGVAKASGPDALMNVQFKAEYAIAKWEVRPCS